MNDLVLGLLIGAGIGLVIFGIIGFVLGITYRKRIGEREIGNAEEEARRIVNESIKTSEIKARESLSETNKIMLETKDEIHKQRQMYDREVKERRQELQNQERRLRQKEETLDRKVDAIEKKDEQMTARLKAAEETREEAERLKRAQTEVLERIGGLTREEARDLLIKNMESEVTHEYAIKINDIKNRAKEESDRNAREIVAYAIQKCAGEHVSEATVSVVPLPSDEMKGRIIGREGRNIRTLEQLTGVDLIIDDTPEAITLSGFDQVRREVARLSLEKLIADGRIHPARIEEVVEKSKREVEITIKQAGESATFETGVHGLNKELVRLLGRLRYRTSYGQNVLKHSIEVSHLAGIMAAELKVDVMLAKRAGLLHDLGKALDHEYEGSHVSIGVDFARKYGEKPDVLHAIEAHHNDVEPQTVEACLVQAADAISAARPGARRENIESYIRRLEKLEELANSFDGVERSFAVQAGREIRIMVKPEKVTDDQMVLMARDLAKKIESDMEYPGQIKVHIIRETRHIDYAK
ncbi:ribonuclease Y [Clostridia bacterium]|nr:ribonuclease Y [Clostridia bacterium]